MSSVISTAAPLPNEASFELVNFFVQHAGGRVERSLRFTKVNGEPVMSALDEVAVLTKRDDSQYLTHTFTAMRKKADGKLDQYIHYVQFPGIFDIWQKSDTA